MGLDMAEPESHALRLLREIRESLQALDAKVDRIHGDLKAGIDGLTQVLAGEIAANRYTTGGFEQKLADFERRLSVLEETR